MEGSSHFGFPCVMSMESQLLAGFITRKEIQDALSTCTLLPQLSEMNPRIYY